MRDYLKIGYIIFLPEDPLILLGKN